MHDSNPIKTGIRWILEALLPPKCLVCKREGRWLCKHHQKFEAPPQNAVHFKHLDDIFAVTKYYASPTDKVVEFFKFHGFQVLGDLMAQEMQKTMAQHHTVFDQGVLMPIPLHWTRQLWRGFNQAQILAQCLHRKNPSIRLNKSLKRQRKTRQQARLKKQERQTNLTDAFVWQGGECPKKIILIDDVVASGETLDSAAKTLKAMGAKTVIGLVFARGGKD